MCAELAVLVGSRRKSTTSASSCSASSIPATSSNETRSVVGSYRCAFARPNPSRPLPAPPERRGYARRGRREQRRPDVDELVNHSGVSLVAGLATTGTSCSCSSRSSSALSANSGTSVLKSRRRRLGVRSARPARMCLDHVVPFAVIVVTLPSRTCSRNMGRYDRTRGFSIAPDRSDADHVIQQEKAEEHTDGAPAEASRLLSVSGPGGTSGAGRFCWVGAILVFSSRRCGRSLVRPSPRRCRRACASLPPRRARRGTLPGSAAEAARRSSAARSGSALADFGRMLPLSGRSPRAASRS